MCKITPLCHDTMQIHRFSQSAMSHGAVSGTASRGAGGHGPSRIVSHKVKRGRAYVQYVRENETERKHYVSVYECERGGALQVGRAAGSQTGHSVLQGSLIISQPLCKNIPFER